MSAMNDTPEPDRYDFAARAEALRTERAEAAAQLRAEGASLREIARALNVDAGTIRGDLQRVGQAPSREEDFRGHYGLPLPTGEHVCRDPVTCDDPSHRARFEGPGLGPDPSDWMRSRRDRQTGH